MCDASVSLRLFDNSFRILAAHVVNYMPHPACHTSHPAHSHTSPVQSVHQLPERSLAHGVGAVLLVQQAGFEGRRENWNQNAVMVEYTAV